MAVTCFILRDILEWMKPNGGNKFKNTFTNIAFQTHSNDPSIGTTNSSGSINTWCQT